MWYTVHVSSAVTRTVFYFFGIPSATSSLPFYQTSSPISILPTWKLATRCLRETLSTKFCHTLLPIGLILNRKLPPAWLRKSYVSTKLVSHIMVAPMPKAKKSAGKTDSAPFGQLSSLMYYNEESSDCQPEVPLSALWSLRAGPG